MVSRIKACMSSNKNEEQKHPIENDSDDIYDMMTTNLKIYSI